MGGDNVADRRLYEAINSFNQHVDADWKAGYSVLVKDPFGTCQRAFCLEGKTKEGLGQEAALHHCRSGFLLHQDFFKRYFLTGVACEKVTHNHLMLPHH